MVHLVQIESFTFVSLRLRCCKLVPENAERALSSTHVKASDNDTRDGNACNRKKWCTLVKPAHIGKQTRWIRSGNEIPSL